MKEKIKLKMEGDDDDQQSKKIAKATNAKAEYDTNLLQELIFAANGLQGSFILPPNDDENKLSEHAVSRNNVNVAQMDPQQRIGSLIKAGINHQHKKAKESIIPRQKQTQQTNLDYVRDQNRNEKIPNAKEIHNNKNNSDGISHVAQIVQQINNNNFVRNEKNIQNSNQEVIANVSRNKAPIEDKNDMNKGIAVQEIPTASVKSVNVIEKQQDLPNWQPDDIAPYCNRCGQYFWIFLRRHHCRHCGLVFCKECSDFSSSMAQYNVTTKVRVCKDCFDMLKIENVTN